MDAPENTGNPVFGKDQPAHYCGKAGRSGPPKGSANNMRHGLKSSKMPEGMKYIEHRCNAMRLQIEEIVLRVKGKATYFDDATINTMMKWEAHGLKAAHWLRHEANNMKPMERLYFSKEIALASAQRDKALLMLNLDAKPEPVVLQDYLIEGSVA